MTYFDNSEASDHQRTVKANSLNPLPSEVKPRLEEFRTGVRFTFLLFDHYKSKKKQSVCGWYDYKNSLPPPPRETKTGI